MLIVTDYVLTESENVNTILQNYSMLVEYAYSGGCKMRVGKVTKIYSSAKNKNKKLVY